MNDIKNFRDDFAYKNPISSVNSFSNPLTSFAKLLFVYGFDSDILSSKNEDKNSFSRLIDYANARLGVPRLTAPLEKFNLYHKRFLEKINRLDGSSVIFLDFTNYTLKNRFGRFYKMGVDDFMISSDVSKVLLNFFQQQEETVLKGIESFVFYRFGIIDLPWKFHFKNSDIEPSFIENIFSDVADNISISMLNKGKSPLGDQVRCIDDVVGDGNYNLGDHIFDFSRWNSIASEEFFDYQYQTVKKNWDKSYLHSFKGISSADFFKVYRTAIHLNKQIMLHKYDSIFSSLSLDKKKHFMLEGDVGLPILKEFFPRIRSPGRKLLKNVKTIPYGGVLEKQSLNRLEGYFRAEFGNGDFLQPLAKSFSKKTVEKPLLQHSISFPAFNSFTTTSDVDLALEKLPSKHLGLLKSFISKYRLGIKPIESLIYLLNYENYPVYTDSKMLNWQDLLADELVVPFEMANLKSEYLLRNVRPSNQGKTCPITIFEPFAKDIPQMKNNYMAIQGNMIHSLVNKLGDKQVSVFDLLDVPRIPKSSYCEVPISRSFNPSSSDIELAIQLTEEKLKKTKIEFYKLVIDYLQNNSSFPIFDGGKADAVLKFDKSNIPLVVDIKRRMASNYPVNYFFKQIGRYLLMLKDKTDIPDVAYGAVVQTPWIYRHYSDREDFNDDGRYKMQKIRIRQYDFKNSNFVNVIKAETLYEYAVIELLKGDILKGYSLRQKQKFKECLSCFSNTDESFGCRFLFDKVMSPWPDPNEELIFASKNF